MPITIGQDDSVYQNDLSVMDAPAFRITGNRVKFINSEGGRAITTSSAEPAIVITGMDAVIINQAGGIIRSSLGETFPEPQLVLLGSQFADRVENSGTITGRVSLGAGDDTFVNVNGVSNYATYIDLGTGDDIFILNGNGQTVGAGRVDGGDGVDRYIIDGVDTNVSSPIVTNVEILELRSDGFIEGFSGLDSIVVNYSGSERFFTALRFMNTPDADVSIIPGTAFSNRVSVYDRSSISSITGSSGRDDIDLGSDTAISGAISLGAGDDLITFRRSQFENPLQQVFGSVIDGGSGEDVISLQLRANDTIDLGNVVDFEELAIRNFDALTSPITVRNLDTFERIVIGLQFTPNRISLNIEASDLTSTVVQIEGLSTINLSSDTVAGQIGTYVPLNPNDATADDTRSITIGNQGVINGAVRLFIGDDVFDSTSGTVNGRVYGFAGNDTIRADAGNHWFEGGFGSDLLSGGAGQDVLFGNSGADTLFGGADRDVLIGGAGNDIYHLGTRNSSIVETLGEGIDEVRTAMPILFLPANVENLTFTGGSAFFGGIGNELANVIAGGTGYDELFGLGGNDTLSDGGGTASCLAGGAGDDIYVVGVRGSSTFEVAGEGRDEVRTSSSVYVLQSNVEVLTFTDNSDHGAGVGNGLDNDLFGALGRDELFGRQGNDRLFGGEGSANVLLGQEGDDTYFVAAQGDSVIEFASEGTDTVRVSLASYRLSANVENLIYNGTAAVQAVGNDLGNTMEGSGGGDFLSGLDGQDVLIGRSGADTLLGGAGADVFRYLGGETGFDRVLDFTTGTDLISLANSGFSRSATIALVQGSGSTAATSAASTFIYNPDTGFLSYDADGTGQGAAVLLAQLNIGLTLSVNDFVLG